MGWSDYIVYGLIGFVIVVSPISWFFDERKRAREKAVPTSVTHTDNEARTT